MFVICHKPTDLPKGECYVPLHVGRKNSKFKEEMKDYVGDDTGDNISDKNPYYCEATGIYWIWKNVHDCEYVGLCHYRRFFGMNFSERKVELSHNTVIMTQPVVCMHDRWYNLLYYISIEDGCILQDVLKILYPEYMNSFTQYARRYYTYRYNMIICKRDDFEKYAEWLFSILCEMEKYVKVSPYKNARRVYAYVSEFLTPLYFIHNGFNIKTVPLVENGTISKIPMVNRFLQFIFQTLLYPRMKNRPLFVDPSIRNGLIEDGIIVR